MEIDIINIVSSVGFPIAITTYLLYFQNKQNERQDQKDEKLNETLNNFSLNMQENTILIRELISTLRGDKDE